MPDEESMLNRSYFNKTTSRTDVDILKDRVISTKDKRGARGSRQYGIHYGLSTKYLGVKFGVSIHFIPTVRNGETGSEKNTLQRYLVNVLWQHR